VPVFRKILIANRGEIALRILRACRDLGIRSVVAYSEADRDSLPVLLADEAVCIGPAPAVRSYNSISAIISAAMVTGCDALHPGYGFLAENASLAEICAECGITFIGPSPDVMVEMSDKATARRIMSRAGLPTVPGTDGPVHDAQAGCEAASDIGYPLVIKAVAGGGGRGMRVARDERDLTRYLPLAQAEAQAAFGDRGVYLERLLIRPRHIEVQVLADEHDRVLSLGERDCSLQRRYQKLVEESPAPNISKKLRDNLAKAAVRGAKAINYTGAGTVEFLVDAGGQFYFTEMNTRIQVEHPVTEMVTGIDLVQWQIRVAAGERLPFGQRQVEARGHAIEVRLNAEDGLRDFAPSGGRVDRLLLPGGPGVRVDSHLYQGYVVPTHYDSLLGKLIVWGEDRDQALARLRRALAETDIGGVATTVEFYQRLLHDPLFLSGDISTHFVPEFLERIGAGVDGRAR
jgi:acetyl-CoA carboxylase, biotin carboxylase subunit